MNEIPSTLVELVNFELFYCLIWLGPWLGRASLVAQMVESACNAGTPDSIHGLGRSLGEGNGNPLKYSFLENPMVEKPGGLQSMGSQRVRHD